MSKNKNTAKTGNPNGNGLPVWEQASKGTMRIGEGLSGMCKVNQMKLWYNMFANKSDGEQRMRL